MRNNKLFYGGIVLIVIILIGGYLGQHFNKNIDPNYQDKVNPSKIPISEPPTINIVFENDPDYIPSCIALQNTWNGKVYDRTNATIPEVIMSGYDKKIMLDNLYKPQTGENLKIRFGDILPDAVNIKMQVLLEGPLGSALPEEIIDYTQEGEFYEFIHPTRSKAEKKVLGRLYMMEVTWGENNCTYAFVIDDSELVTN